MVMFPKKSRRAKTTMRVIARARPLSQIISRVENPLKMEEAAGSSGLESGDLFLPESTASSSARALEIFGSPPAGELDSMSASGSIRAEPSSNCSVRSWLVLNRGGVPVAA